MPTVDQMIRTTAKGLSGIPYWVVEKDYAISYLLAGIARIDRLSEGLILKGGTALSTGWSVTRGRGGRVVCLMKQKGAER